MQDSMELAQGCPVHARPIAAADGLTSEQKRLQEEPHEGEYLIGIGAVREQRRERDAR